MTLKLPLALALATLLTNPGCLLLFAQPSCPGEGIDSEGELLLGDAEFAPVATFMDIGTADAGECVTEVFIDLDFGRDCSMWVRADGGEEVLSVYEIVVFGSDGCGFDPGLSLLDVGASTIEVDGALKPTPDSEMTCWDGDLVIHLDALLESDDASVPLTGDLTVSGIENANVNEQRCG